MKFNSEMVPLVMVLLVMVPVVAKRLAAVRFVDEALPKVI